MKSIGQNFSLPRIGTVLGCESDDDQELDDNKFQSKFLTPLTPPSSQTQLDDIFGDDSDDEGDQTEPQILSDKVETETEAQFSYKMDKLLHNESLGMAVESVDVSHIENNDDDAETSVDEQGDGQSHDVSDDDEDAPNGNAEQMNQEVDDEDVIDARSKAVLDSEMDVRAFIDLANTMQ